MKIDHSLVRAYLEYEIKRTRGGLITVKTKRFFRFLGSTPRGGNTCIKFWQLVEEIAPELGLRVLERVYRRVGNPSKIVFIKP